MVGELAQYGTFPVGVGPTRLFHSCGFVIQLSTTVPYTLLLDERKCTSGQHSIVDVNAVYNYEQEVEHITI